MKEQCKLTIGDSYYINQRMESRPHEPNESCSVCKPDVLQPQLYGSDSSLISSSLPLSQGQPNSSQTLSKSGTPTQVAAAKQGVSPVYPTGVDKRGSSCRGSSSHDPIDVDESQGEPARRSSAMKRHLLDSSPSDRSQQLGRSNKPSKQALVRKAKQELSTNSKRLSTIAEEMKGLIETIKELAEDDDLSDGLVGTKRRRAEK